MVKLQRVRALSSAQSPPAPSRVTGWTQAAQAGLRSSAAACTELNLLLAGEARQESREVGLGQPVLYCQQGKGTVQSQRKRDAAEL